MISHFTSSFGNGFDFPADTVSMVMDCWHFYRGTGWITAFLLLMYRGIDPLDDARLPVSRSSFAEKVVPPSRAAFPSVACQLPLGEARHSFAYHRVK